MDVPNLTGYDLLLPLDEEERSWLGRSKEAAGVEGIDLIFVEKLSDEFLGRDDLLGRIVEATDEAARFDHANIHRTYAAGYLDGDFSIVHTFPVGERLDTLLASGLPPMPVTLRMVADLIEGLAAVHENTGEIHGAISPKVIYVGWDGCTRLARFGPEKTVRRVRHNWGVLNPRQLSYLSPEHCMNEPRNRRTDIFNLGIVLWELLTGRVLFEEEDDFERMRAICERDAPPPTRYNESIPPLLNSLTLKALAIEPDQRFPDAVRLREVFQGVLKRSQSAATEREVVEFVRSLDAGRYRHWKRLERARQKGDLHGVLEHAAALHGTNTDRAQTAEEGVRTDASPGDPPLDAPTEKLSQDVKRQVVEASESGQMPADNPEEEPAHPVAQDFEIDDGTRPPDATVDESIQDLADDEWLQDRLGDGQSPENETIEEDFSDAELEGFDPFADEVEETTSEAVDVPSSEEIASEAGISDVTVDEPPSSTRLGVGEVRDEQEARTERNEEIADITIDEPAPTPEEDGDADVTVDQTPPQPEDGGDEKPKSAHELIVGDAGDDEESETAANDEEPASPTRDFDDIDIREEGTPNQPAEAPELEDPTTRRTRSQRDPEESLRDDLGEDLSNSPRASADAQAERPPEEDFAERAEPGAPPEVPDASDEPDAFASDLQRMSIDDWLDEDDEEAPHVEPFPIEDVIEDKGESEQARVRRPALEIIRLGRQQPLDVTVLRGRDRWSKEGIPVKVRSKGGEASIELQPPSRGWVARAQDPGTRRDLPNPPATLELKPGDIAEITDGDVRYRFRFFHPPKSPHHIERENFGMSLGVYGMAFALAVIFHALAALGILTLQSSFGIAMSVESKPRKEVFAAGKLKEPDKKKDEPKQKKKDKPEPPEPPEPEDPAEQEANVPEQIQKEIEQKLDQKQQKSEDKTKAEALASALQGSSDSDEESVGKSISNIDAVDSPSGTSSEVEIGGKLEGTEGTDVKMETGSEATELGEIGSKIGEGTGDLKARDKKEKVRGTVDSVQSQAKVEGRLARSKVAKVVREHSGKIQGCYEQELLNNPGLSGKVTFEWTITRSGRVSGARQKSSTLGSGDVSNCILGIIRGMRFPKPRGGAVSITYPFMFRSGG